jgi:hypothetical protein
MPQGIGYPAPTLSGAVRAGPKKKKNSLRNAPGSRKGHSRGVGAGPITINRKTRSYSATGDASP